VPGKTGASKGDPYWTEQRLVEAALEWERLYGRLPRYNDWNIHRLRERAERKSAEADEAWQAYARYVDGNWPAFGTLIRTFRRLADFYAAVARRRSADAVAAIEKIDGSENDRDDTADHGDDQRDVGEVSEHPGADDDHGDGR
jgi:hypothetical protein